MVNQERYENKGTGGKSKTTQQQQNKGTHFTLHRGQICTYTSNTSFTEQQQSEPRSPRENQIRVASPEECQDDESLAQNCTLQKSTLCSVFSCSDRVCMRVCKPRKRVTNGGKTTAADRVCQHNKPQVCPEYSVEKISDDCSQHHERGESPTATN